MTVVTTATESHKGKQEDERRVREREREERAVTYTPSYCYFTRISCHAARVVPEQGAASYMGGLFFKTKTFRFKKATIQNAKRKPLFF